ncbi:hypothetical protein [Costertonia aggregata]|uniref:Uncharacterized protein n=1 Tax=Costertonia aggregata TaxID=343403 RepID=A0A7H9AQD0_9FLAO|nr:hypothetical protein [Costertonia aggregata]QLG45691.1 hypothetical protein HYG79_10140 [Costertonia aggregata]
MFKILKISALFLIFGFADQYANTDQQLPQQQKLNGIYEYVYPYNSSDTLENHYLQFEKGKIFYYGTSDDFDMAREGYEVGFFSVEIPFVDYYQNTINFSVGVSESDMYKKPITPSKNEGNNTLWGMSLTHNSINYQGEIKDNGNTIVISSEGIDDRTFVKIK